MDCRPDAGEWWWRCKPDGATCNEEDRWSETTLFPRSDTVPVQPTARQHPESKRVTENVISTDSDCLHGLLLGKAHLHMGQQKVHWFSGKVSTIITVLVRRRRALTCALDHEQIVHFSKPVESVIQIGNNWFYRHMMEHYRWRAVQSRSFEMQNSIESMPVSFGKTLVLSFKISKSCSLTPWIFRGNNSADRCSDQLL